MPTLFFRIGACDPTRSEKLFSARGVFENEEMRFINIHQQIRNHYKTIINDHLRIIRDIQRRFYQSKHCFFSRSILQPSQRRTRAWHAPWTWYNISCRRPDLKPSRNAGRSSLISNGAPILIYKCHVLLII